MSIRVTSKRPKGKKWRQAVFAALCDRDGATCRKCGDAHRVIWRRNGRCSSSDYGDAPHTIVFPTSILEVDHQTPLSEGGDNEIGNLWLLCMDCHKKKTSAERSARLKRLFAEART